MDTPARGNFRARLGTKHLQSNAAGAGPVTVEAVIAALRVELPDAEISWEQWGDNPQTPTLMIDVYDTQHVLGLDFDDLAGMTVAEYAREIAELVEAQHG